MLFVIDTAWKAFWIQMGMLLGGNIVPIVLHAVFGVPYMDLGESL